MHQPGNLTLKVCNYDIKGDKCNKGQWWGKVSNWWAFVLITDDRVEVKTSVKSQGRGLLR